MKMAIKTDFKEFAAQFKNIPEKGSNVDAVGCDCVYIVSVWLRMHATKKEEEPWKIL